MKEINWSYFAALFSLVLGWLLIELSQWFRTLQEDLKIKKQILYNLLEINFIFNQLETSEITQLLIDRILLRVPFEDQTEEFKQSINLLCSVIIGRLLEDNVAKNLDNMEAKYLKAVDDLAKIDPISAYRLNGKTNIMHIFDLSDKYFEEVNKHFTEGVEEELQGQITSTINILKPEIIKDAISDLEEEIKDIAFSINPWVQYKVKRLLQLSKKRIKDEFPNKIDELLDIAISFGYTF